MRLYMVGCLAGILVLGLFIVAAVWASTDSRPDYQGYDITAPWFDGKPFNYYREMIDNPSIKPQEIGTFQRFPEHSVPRTGVEPEVPNTFNAQGALRDLIPKNPTQATAASIKKGRKLFNIYCAACHGKDGLADTPVVKKGMPAPAINALVSVFSGAHLYNKIRYGGPIMPTFGFQTSQSDRWDMVNYLKSPQFGK
ncbi:MAG: cytochrome c [bacterium]